MLEIKGYSKSYGDKLVVKDVNLTVADGELFGFIGHNGAGKTTTIKSVVGILEFNGGTILINGKDITKQPIECKKELAYIPDNPDLYESLTGIKYLNFIADIFEIGKEEREKSIRYYATEFDILDNLGDTISSYSHGMKQKIAIISALIHNPKILILDEPFVGLDPKAAHTLKAIMRKMCDEGGSIFFSTHVLEVAEKLCDRIAIIKDGDIVAYGKMEDIIGKKTLEQVFLELIDHD